MSRRVAAFLTTILLAGSLSASSLAEQMKEVERLRGLTFLHDVTQTTIDRSALPKLLREQLDKSLPYSADDYALILRSLQLVDADTPDLVGKMLGLYESQVLAFYDPMTHTYFAIKQMPAAFAGLDDPGILRDSVVIHELTHALQDQRFHAGMRDMALRKDTDGGLAYHALMEGEATLVMLAYLLDKSGASIDALVANESMLNGLMSAVDMDKTIDASTPRYFAASLKFPYEEGLKLAVDGYKRGGWKMLDRMNENPPRSTREVLHPTAYFARLEHGDGGRPPFDDTPPPTLPGVLTVEHLGEFHWRFLVGDAGAGWVDDRVTVAQNKACDVTVLVDTTWESPARARAFRDAYVSFLEGRGLAPRVAMNGSGVKVAYGADTALAQRFVQ